MTIGWITQMRKKIVFSVQSEEQLVCCSSTRWNLHCINTQRIIASYDKALHNYKYLQYKIICYPEVLQKHRLFVNLYGTAIIKLRHWTAMRREQWRGGDNDGCPTTSQPLSPPCGNWWLLLAAGVTGCCAGWGADHCSGPPVATTSPQHSQHM